MKQTKSLSALPKKQESTEPTYTETLKDRLAAARNSDQIAGLSDDQKDKAFELLDLMVKQAERCHNPEITTDCIIEMGLMKGGVIKVIEPTAYHSMQAKRQMNLFSEKGDKEEMLPMYTLAACAEIDGKPAALHELLEKLTARDFNVLLGFFCRINLL